MTSNDNARRVVITGTGVTSSIGHSVDESMKALRAGEHGIRFMPEWDFLPDMQCRLGAPVEGLDLKTFYPRKKRRTMARVGFMAVHAAEQAVNQSGLDEETLHSERTGVAFGSTSGSGSEMEVFSTPLALDHTMRGLESNSYFRFMTHTCAVNVGYFFRVRGRIVPTCTACTSGSQGIGTGYEMIRHGTADVVLAGGAEELHYTSAVTFDLLMATSVKYNEQPDQSPRPFDKKRDGLVVGEGGGACVLESLEHAQKRGAPILAEVLSYASNCDGSHLTVPDQGGMERVMRLALEQAGVGPNDIDYVNAHGTGTGIGDVTESQATRAVFERKVPVSSLKGYVGHTLGACGAIEVAWCEAMMREGIVLPGRNLTEVDPNCADLDYVREVRDTKPTLIMSNNFAFGGINTSIVLGPPPR